MPLVDGSVCHQSTVSEVLKRLGLEKHSHIFEKNEINYKAFKLLEESDLRDLELPIGARAILRDEIKRIKNDETIRKCKLMSDI